MKIPEFLKGWFGRNQNEPDPEEVEELRRDFKARYHHFKLLLNANNEALESMSELEEALRGLSPFGMQFIRARVTRVSSAVFNIIRNLDQLAPNRYGELFNRFKDIQNSINDRLAAVPRRGGDPLVLGMEEVGPETVELAGSKMSNLGEAARALKLPAPEGFVVTAEAQKAFLAEGGLQDEINRRIQTSDPARPDRLQALSSSIQQLILAAELPREVEEAIDAEVGKLTWVYGQDVMLALRSSALGEDAQGTSFAGQYRSELNVAPDSVTEVYKVIVASKYSAQAMAYRLHKGIPAEETAMCVGVLRMINAASGGVAYSRDPMNTCDECVVVSSAWGLPQAVVEGSGLTDLFKVTRAPDRKILERRLSGQRRKYVVGRGEGIRRADLAEEEKGKASLTDAQAMEVADVAARLEDYFGLPQDVEWCIEGDGRLILLQCRPLLTSGSDTRLRKLAGDAVELAAGGITASPGVAAGPVHVIAKEADAMTFPQGGVMVLAQPYPRRAALLSRAAAVVAEEGGLAGHLANVAREFEIPAIFGVDDAVAKLSGRGEVTVDADARAIYQGRVDELLEADRRPPRNIMEGTRVYETLTNITPFIVPLNLIDPDATSFRPSACRTLHDITRFCHEKSVEEMFSFGRDHHFPERSSKRLVYETPMQFWIINLDDGFKHEVDKAEVKLSNIVSIPMIALWKGMMAKTWGGPPPVDAKGFMAVLFEATANPHLNESSGSKFTVRNYFLISRNFVSLQSRFGFHFCTVEALVGDRDNENYITFRFKGGAANIQRRTARAWMVADLLGPYGFMNDIVEDSLTARLEGKSKEIMEHRLEVVGYLIIHTRQVDMVMADPAAVARIRNEMATDLRSLMPAPDNIDETGASGEEAEDETPPPAQ